jgi:hypothetical protein
VEVGPGRRDLGKPPFDRGVDVLVGFLELELARVELALYPPEATLDGCEPAPGQKARRREAARVGEAARDVERVELEIDLERRRELLELREKRAAKTPAPELDRCYGVSLLTSPSRLPISRACSCP